MRIFTVFISYARYRISALLDGLKSNFSEVTVEVVECPDLQSAPFHLACKGDFIFAYCVKEHPY